MVSHIEGRVGGSVGVAEGVGLSPEGVENLSQTPDERAVEAGIPPLPDRVPGTVQYALGQTAVD
jgi:hypothetical protein